MGKYDDIMELPHHRSHYRTPMSIENRAAQFAPFAALSGHDEAIAETSRLTNARIELTNEEKLEIARLIKDSYSSQESVSITYFIPDKAKAGGSYAAIRGRISKVDEYDHLVTLDNGIVLPMDNIKSIICKIEL